MTLPLIYVLNNSNSSDRKWIINIVKNKHKDSKKVKELIKHIIEKKGLDYATKKMYYYKQKAMNILEKMPENEYKSSLELMTNYVIDRKI